MTIETAAPWRPADPADRVPSRRSRLAALWLRLTWRPIGKFVPGNRAGVAVARLMLGSLLRLMGGTRGARVERVEERVRGARLAGEWVRAKDATNSQAVVLYLHGSGYVACSARSHRGLTSSLSRLTGLPVFALDYRLAPRHPFPAAADDALAAYRWLLAQGFGADRIVVAGDSAGGYMSLALAVDAHREGLPVPAGLVLFSPLVDHTFELARVRDRRVWDPFFSPALARRLVGLYTAGSDPDDPRLTLKPSDITALPPMLIQAGGLESLSADAEHLGRLVAAAGGACELQIWPGQVHVFQAAFRLFPESRAALQDAGRFIRSVIDPGAAREDAI